MGQFASLPQTRCVFDRYRHQELAIHYQSYNLHRFSFGVVAPLPSYSVPWLFPLCLKPQLAIKSSASALLCIHVLYKIAYFYQLGTTK